MDLPSPLTIRTILEHYDAHTWTTMGFGMIRTYLDEAKRWRLNVWDDRLQVPDVSTIHDHPWSFTSYIFAGEMRNQRFNVMNLEFNVGEATHEWHSIKTGEGGGPVEEPHFARLDALPLERYYPGHDYHQKLDEVHETMYERGTVSLNDRSAPTEAYTARVFWPVGTKWVDAMPRPATKREIEDTVAVALHLFDRRAKYFDESGVIRKEVWDALEPNQVLDRHAAGR